jgi:anti-anti-sigma factor
MPEVRDIALWRTDEQGPAFACVVEHQTDRVVVSLHGELDLASAPGLERRLLELLSMPLRSVTVDVSQITFMDSAGLGALLRACRTAGDRNLGFHITGAGRDSPR